MNSMPRFTTQSRRTATLALLLGLLVVQTTSGQSVSEVDGFTEPYRTVNVATAEMGTITDVQVREGEIVHKGQVIATLDNRVIKSLLAVAEQDMNSKGRLESSFAELQLREERLKKLELLRSRGHARQEEVERARTDVAVSKARLLTVQEEILVKRLEYEKIKTQLNRRTILAPMDGTITTLHKQVGEFAAPNDPFIVTLVQLDPLLAVFSTPSDDAMRLQVDEKVSVEMANQSQPLEGSIELIAPVDDAESGTVRVKVRIDNPEGKLRSGQRCTLKLQRKRTGN